MLFANGITYTLDIAFNRKGKSIVSTLAMLGRSSARSLLAPGDLACNATGVMHEDGRGLVRMLAKVFVGLIVGIAVVLRVA